MASVASRWQLRVAPLSPPPAAAAQSAKAFPTAEEFGTEAIGDRGGRVIEVTTLDASGEGTLRSAMEAFGPRVVFRVSGTITLKNAIRVRTPYLTVAGQTSPGGVQIRANGQPKGVRFVNGAHDIVVRRLRVRVGGNMKHDASNNLLCYGMPDAWEKAHGLAPNNARDGAATAANGYTNVENCLNELAAIPSRKATAAHRSRRDGHEPPESPMNCRGALKSAGATGGPGNCVRIRALATMISG